MNVSSQGSCAPLKPEEGTVLQSKKEKSNDLIICHAYIFYPLINIDTVDLYV